MFDGTVDKKQIDLDIERRIKDEHEAERYSKAEQARMIHQVSAFARKDK